MGNFYFILFYFSGLFHFMYLFVPFQNFRIPNLFSINSWLKCHISEKPYLNNLCKVTIVFLPQCSTMESHYPPKHAIFFLIALSIDILYTYLMTLTFSRNSFYEDKDCIWFVYWLFPATWTWAWNVKGTPKILLKELFDVNKYYITRKYCIFKLHIYFKLSTLWEQ